MQVSAAPPTEYGQKFSPAIVVDRIDIGSMIKYILRFDDGVVSVPDHLHLDAQQSYMMQPSHLYPKDPSHTDISQ